MLKEYFWSLTFVAVMLLAYTAAVLIKKPTDITRAAASIKMPAAALVPSSGATSASTAPAAATAP